MPHTQALYGEIQQAIHSRTLAISHYVLYTLRVSRSSWRRDSDNNDTHRKQKPLSKYIIKRNNRSIDYWMLPCQKTTWMLELSCTSISVDTVALAIMYHANQWHQLWRLWRHHRFCYDSARFSEILNSFAYHIYWLPYRLSRMRGVLWSCFYNGMKHLLLYFPISLVAQEKLHDC